MLGREKGFRKRGGKDSSVGFAKRNIVGMIL